MSRNYQEDQLNEIEALDSIYCGELEGKSKYFGIIFIELMSMISTSFVVVVLATEPVHKFRLPIATELFDKATQDNGFACKLSFTYAPTYPDEAPAVTIDDPIALEDDLEERLLAHIQKTIEENLGMEMIFSVVSAAQEWLNERWDEHITNLEEERLQKVRKAEEEERKKFEGTRVTLETFMKWKLDFEEEMGIAAKREKSNENKKLTGRELFANDQTLNESDLQFLLEAGESLEQVKVDEDLFRSDELDITNDSDFDDIDDDDEDEEDDEDWEPDDD